MFVRQLSGRESRVLVPWQINDDQQCRCCAGQRKENFALMIVTNATGCMGADKVSKVDRLMKRDRQITEISEFIVNPLTHRQTPAVVQLVFSDSSCKRHGPDYSARAAACQGFSWNSWVTASYSNQVWTPRCCRRSGVRPHRRQVTGSAVSQTYGSCMRVQRLRRAYWNSLWHCSTTANSNM